MDTLARIVSEAPPFAIAVSGGVDSMTLAIFAHYIRPDIAVFHAVSPAVSPRATRRVRRYASRRGWRLQEIVAGEFEDEKYLSNPYNRCFFCKMNLYAEIRHHTDRLIVSGTNLDDLADFRPGLKAADVHNVRHPFVEAKLRKADVRALADELGAVALADLPASPCLSSRIETGIVIDAATLRSVDKVELWLSETFRARTARCRVRKNEITIELDDDLYRRLGVSDRLSIHDKVRSAFGDPKAAKIQVEVYRMGSAFLRDERRT